MSFKPRPPLTPNDGLPTERSSVRLLVVDESSSYYDQIKEYAEVYSHQIELVVAHAESASSAIEELRKFKPSVVLVDMHIPDMNGLDLIDRCKDEIQAVVVTSQTPSKEIETSALQHGAKAYVSKGEAPEDFENLIETLTRYAHIVRTEQH